MPSRADTQWLHLRQTAALLAPWRTVLNARQPKQGWISTIRHAIGMSSTQLATRMGITRQSLKALEKREGDGGATLDALRRAADALGCDLVYALVPKKGSLEAHVEAQARAVARRLVARAGHTMALEAQGVEDDETPQQIEVVTRRLLAEWPRDLWDRPTGAPAHRDAARYGTDAAPKPGADEA